MKQINKANRVLMPTHHSHYCSFTECSKSAVASNSTSCYKFIAILKNTEIEYRGASNTAPYMFIFTLGASDLAPL